MLWIVPSECLKSISQNIKTVVERLNEEYSNNWQNFSVSPFQSKTGVII